MIPRAAITLMAVGCRDDQRLSALLGRGPTALQDLAGAGTRTARPLARSGIYPVRAIATFAPARKYVLTIGPR